MRVYKTPEIRNVAVVGHGASGKTSLVDALAFVAGTSKRHGSVKDGTALTDYTADEIERKYSINLALAVAEWMDTKLNLIDAPGYLDFLGETTTALHTADAAVVVVGAVGGVEVGLATVLVGAAQKRAPKETRTFRTVPPELLEQVVDDRLLAVDPAGRQKEEEGERGRHGVHESPTSTGSADTSRRAGNQGW